MLLFSVTPGLSEVVETVMHAMVDGDFSHHEDAEAPETCEHSCTPLSHHCGCHVAMSAQAAARTESLASVHEVTTCAAIAIAQTDGRASGPPPQRPPIV